ncbi:MAG: tetratricopeptide repeat protein [Janthinobacterium lividum]
MSDFIREVDEEYRQDQFRNFLSRYWVALLLLVVVVLAGAGGWRGYQYYRQQQAEAAGARYFDALDTSAADAKAATAALDALAKDGPEGYRVLARFRSASDLGRSDASAGAKAFDSIAADPAIAQEFRDIAGLRAGILTVDSGDAAELQRRLGPLADTNSPYRSLAREMLAVAALKRGDTAAATKWLDAIKTDALASPDSRQRAGFFLTLAQTPQPVVPPAAPAQPAAQP